MSTLNYEQSVVICVVAIVMRMQGLSSDFRIGFGSFIDKPVDPFTDNIK